MITIQNINVGSITIKSLYYGPTLLASGTSVVSLVDFFPISMLISLSPTIIISDKTQTPSFLTIKSTPNNFIIKEI